MNRLFQFFALLLAGTVILPAAETHWAFRPLAQPIGKNVDHFIERRLAAARLQPAADAESQRLIRRLYLDLIGLAPTWEESVEFAKDPSVTRYRAVVNDLLSRPQYGERWGRHWLDLARYADSNGLHQDTDRPHAWRYRDYVINSFNVDKPYGLFIREQLAGDEIDPENPAAWIATGFCRNGPSNEENIAKNEVVSYRLDQLDDILSTTSQVFLGQSIGCARCHDHKTEPFLLKDYYQLRAVFDSTVAAFVPFSQGKLGAPSYKPPKARDKYKPPKTPSIRALTVQPGVNRTTKLLFRGSLDLPGETVTANIPVVLRDVPVAYKSLAGANRRGHRTALADWIAAPGNPLTWRVMANRVWQYHFGRGLVNTPNNFGVSGAKPSHSELLDWLACKLRDNGGRLKPLHRLILLSKAYRQSSAFRAAAAELDPENELLWRYPPHRLQAEVIRDNILAASGNLNLKTGGPGIKPRVPPEILEQSKRNNWPKVETENKTHWRRSVYIYLKRQLPMPMLELFDAPDAAQTCAQRFSSTTPTQALTLLNDQFVNKQARWFALRSMNLEEPVKHMFEKAWGLPVAEERLIEARAFVEGRLKTRGNSREGRKLAFADLAIVLFNSSQFVYVD